MELNSHLATYLNEGPSACTYDIKSRGMHALAHIVIPPPKKNMMSRIDTVLTNLGLGLDATSFRDWAWDHLCRHYERVLHRRNPIMPAIVDDVLVN